MKDYAVLKFNYKTDKKEYIFPTEDSHEIYEKLKKMADMNIIFKEDPTEIKNGKLYKYSIFAPWISGSDWRGDKEGFSVLPLDIYIKDPETEETIGAFITRILEKSNYSHYEVSFSYTEMDRDTFEAYEKDSYNPEIVYAETGEGLKLVRDILMKFYNLHSEVWEKKNIKNKLIKNINEMIF